MRERGSPESVKDLAESILEKEQRIAEILRSIKSLLAQKL